MKDYLDECAMLIAQAQDQLGCAMGEGNASSSSAWSAMRELDALLKSANQLANYASARMRRDET